MIDFIFSYSMDILQTEEERNPLIKQSNGELAFKDKLYISDRVVYKYTNNVVTLCILAFCKYLFVQKN